MLLSGILFSSCQKSIREVKQARLVNTVLGATMRTHVLGLLLHLNAILETLSTKDFSYTLQQVHPNY